jgi:hypothetical protein
MSKPKIFYASPIRNNYIPIYKIKFKFKLKEGILSRINIAIFTFCALGVKDIFVSWK